jgi:hypothetical protein
MSSVLLLLALSGSVSSGCVDPARDLRALALDHVIAHADQTLGTRRMIDGLTRYFETGSRTDQLTATTRYTNLGTGRYSRRDLALGLIYASSPDLLPERTHGYRNRRMLLYTNTEDMAMRHLVAALERHPNDWIAGAGMAAVALGTRNPELLGTAREQLTALLARDTARTMVRLALADVLIGRDSAAAARALLEGWQTECPAAAHVYSEALMLTGDTAAGAVLYIETLRSSETQLERFIEDVILTLPYDDRYALERVAPAERRQWLVEWWDRSSARSARTLEERVAAHVRRVVQAQQLYRKAHNPVLPPGNLSDRLLVSHAPPWDARGEVFIRHGQPDTVISTERGVLMYIPQNESWLYARGEPQWLFNFVWGEGADWRLASPWIGCGGTGRPPLERRWNMSQTAGPRPDPAFTVPSSPEGAMFARDYYNDRAPFDEFSAAFMRHCGKVWGGAGELEIHNAIRKSQIAYDTLMTRTLRSESARHPLKNRIRLHVNTYAFRTPGGERERTAVMQWPKADLGGMPQGEAVLQVAVVGSAGAPLRRDTVIAFSQLQAERDPVSATHMTWTGALPADARLFTFAADGTDAQRGSYNENDIPDVGVGGAAISSIVVAAPGANGPLVRGTTSLWPRPAHRVLLGETFRLFYEVYGLPADEPIRTKVTVVHDDAERMRSLLDVFRGRRGDRVLEFDGTAEHDGRGIVVHDLEIGGDLVPGTYTVTVEITTRTAGRLTRTAALVVRDPGASALD